MYYRILSLLLFALQTAFLFAQTNTPFDKEHVTDADGLKKALAALRQGDAQFEKGGSYLAEALKHYEQAYAVNPNNADLAMKIGLCHINGPFRQKALPYFQQVLALDPEMPRIHFLLGYTYQLNAQWDEAITEFKVQRSIVLHTPDADRTYNMADKHISECKYGKTYMAHPVNAVVKNLGPGINTEAPDYGVLVSADGEHMMFTSRRSNTTGGRLNKLTNEYFEDIYACDLVAGDWSAPEPMKQPVNSPVNDASVGLFNDGRTMIIYRDAQGSGDLFESTRKGDSWDEPRPFGPNINTPFQETSGWYSFDRQWLYFVSDREGGLGGLDIYRSPWDATANTWGPAENLGPTINTQYDEDGVFAQADGKTLYFASQGHTSMGGFDLFQTTLTDGAWAKPENLGWPINSPGNDLFFLLTADGRNGYFNSVRNDGLGEDDIYSVEMLPTMVPDPDAMLASAASAVPMIAADAKLGTVLVRGSIKDLVSIKGVEADIDMMDLQDARLVAKFSSDENTGEFMVVVPGGREYGMNVHAEGYLMHSENVSIPLAGGAVDLNIDIKLQPLSAGAEGVMNNIFFDFDRATLNKRSLAELGQVVAMLRENPKVRVEIGGHTDSDGSIAHNQELSERRARAVVKHLVANGIAADRLEAKGYGKKKPRVPNTSAANKAQNRRTEMRVL